MKCPLSEPLQWLVWIHSCTLQCCHANSDIQCCDEVMSHSVNDCCHIEVRQRFPSYISFSFSCPQATHFYKCCVTQVKPRTLQKNHARRCGRVSYERMVERNTRFTSKLSNARRKGVSQSAGPETHQDIKLPQIPTKPNYAHSKRKYLTHRNKITYNRTQDQLLLGPKLQLYPDPQITAH